MGALARQHQIHGAQPVLPVPDVAAAADWFVRVLGFDVDFLYGDAPHVHGRVKCGQPGPEGWGAPIYIHLSRRTSPLQTGAEIRLHVGHDIDGLHRHAIDAGATVLEAPSTSPGACANSCCRRPAGTGCCWAPKRHRTEPRAPGRRRRPACPNRLNAADKPSEPQAMGARPYCLECTPLAATP